MSACYGCMKYGVIYVALLFLLTGAAIVGLSAYLLAEQEGYMDLARPTVTDQDSYYLMYGKWFLVVAGSLMLIGGLLGCCGGFKQSSTLLTLFFAIVLLISFAELAAGVYCYLHQDDFVNHFRNLMKNSVQNYYGVEEYRTKAWDMIQIEMKCCGATGYKDYSSNILLRGNKPQEGQGAIDMTLSAIAPTSYEVPKSCCMLDVADSQCDKARTIPFTASLPIVGDVFTSSLIYKEGCAEKFIDWTKSKAPYFIGTLIGIGSVQLFCLLFTCVLIFAYRGRRSYKN